MRYSSCFTYVLSIVISATLVIVGHSFVLQRSLNGPTHYLTIGGDTNNYVSMAEGDFSSVGFPYRYRVIVPLIASLLPFSPTEALRVISYVSLFTCYVLLLLTCSKLGLDTYMSVGGLLTVFVSTWHIYNYHNPFLTDAFALMALSAMIFSLIHGSFLIFAISAIVGVLARETTIFLVPVWSVARGWRKGILLVAVTIVVFLIPRFIFPSGLSLIEQLTTHFRYVDAFGNPFFFIEGIAKSWGFTWFLALIGIFLIPIESFISVGSAFGLLLLGAFLFSLIAVDTQRMYSILTPVLVIPCAQLFAELKKQIGSGLWALILIGLVVGQGFFSLPNIFFGKKSWVFMNIWPRLVLQILGVICGLCIIFVLRELLLREVREKATEIRTIMLKRHCSRRRPASWKRSE